MKEPFTRILLLVFAALVLPVPSFANDSGGRSFGSWIWGIQGGALHQFDTSLSDSPGSFSVNRLFIEPSLGYAWDRRNMVSVSLGFGDSDYDFSSDATIGGQQPWGRIRDYRLSVPIRFSPSERTNAIVIPSVRSNTEEGASLDDGRTEGVLAGVGWTVSEKLIIGPGIGWFSKLGGGSNIFPIIVIDWELTDRWSLTTGRGLAASQGPGLTLNYTLDEHWKVALTGRYEQIRFAVDDNSLSGGRVGEDESLPLFLSVQYSPWPFTTIGAFVGGDFEGTLSLEDSTGHTIARSDYDIAPTFGLVFRSRF